MTQEFHLSITPIRDNEYLVRTEQVAPGVPLAEEHLIWYVDDWLTEAGLLMGDPLIGLLRSGIGSDTGSIQNRTSAFSSLNQSKAAANLVAFGQRLYNALFQGTIRDSWMMAQGIAQHQHQRLRFRLGLKGTKLHRLPWEVLYAGDRPLATGTEVIFSRYHSSFAVLKSHQPFRKAVTGDSSQALKILMVLSAPSDQEVLALRQEAAHLQQELKATTQTSVSQFSAIELTILEQPGREELTQALEHNHYQVLHYAGHSDLSAAGGSLYLVNNRTGLTEVLSGEDLAGLLVNNGVRMAVFNSCRGVYTATADSGQTGEGNLAESLVRRGIPAVLAMAERIPDDVALNLSRLFYRNLKQAYPIDLSLSRTRQGLVSSYGSDQLYWALPILYLHPEFDGFLQPLVSHSAQSVEPPFAGVGYSGFYNTFETPVLGIEPGEAGFENGRSPVLTQADPSVVASSPAADVHTGSVLIDQEAVPDFDDLEFDDPDPPEEERVAQLVHELSHSPTLLEPEEPMLPASAAESLLPTSRGKPKQEEYFQALNAGQYGTSTASGNVRSGSSALLSSRPADALLDVDDTKVYSELENVLADMGTLTDEITAGSRAVQENPNSVEAYTNLGWALYQKGYLTEAIAAYNQAIRLDSGCAIAFNRLGLAFYQQGKVNEAIKAYSRAVQLDPTLTEASTNLRNALSDQGNPPVPISPSLPIQKPQPAAKLVTTLAKPRNVWLWGGVGAIALSAALASWFYWDKLAPLLPLPNFSNSTSAEPSNPLKHLPPSVLTTLATEELQKGNVAEAEKAITTLLDNKPNALEDTDRWLQAVPSQYAEEPAILFLKGRLAWQRWLAQRDTSAEPARELWDKAVKADPTPQRLNALGFAYYAQGKLDRAEQTWWTSLRLAGKNADPNQPSQANAPFKPETLTAYAGLALTAMKSAENQPPDQQAILRDAALKRRQMVLQNDAVNFRPDALAKNWMWSEKAIQDWETLLKL
ncbi:Flp pilus assembly protein TadD [Leptolyngbyaceae cyanobacterium JSC-12]|nr:Flp pilus assembly protein TadD [Leptolyngbyaceae cyanobacterium JSC-12]